VKPAACRSGVKPACPPFIARKFFAGLTEIEILEAHALTIVLTLIAIILLFEFTNGLNDSATLVVTSVITGAMEPRKVLLIIACFEFIGALFLGTAVALTLGKGIVSPQDISLAAIFSAILGAILWNLGNWFFGMPSSSSHALIGGLVGAVAMGSGFHSIHWGKVLGVLGILILTPFLGLITGHFLTKRTLTLFENFSPAKANRILKRWQILTSITLALSHGSNDAQKGMGMISLALMIFHKISPEMIGRIYNPLPENSFYVPLWVILATSITLALGVSSGSWRIMKTLGTRLYKVRPIHGFSAQLCASAIIYLASFFGFPVSTTQIVSSSILGAGAAQGFGSVRWGVGRQIFFTWIITIPGAAILSALILILVRIWI
jgi:PiT family inorganic phosphate transporter